MSNALALDLMTVGEIVEAVTTPPIPFHITAFDGSSTGPEDARYRLHVANKEAVAYVATAPGDLGLTRAYLMGDLIVEGEHPGHPYGIFDALKEFYSCFSKPDAGTILKIMRSLRHMDALKFQAIPSMEQAPAWRKALINGLASRHSKQRDKNSVSYHYDVGNDFYSLFLGPTMTYTCAYYPTPDSSLEEAQENKHRLIFEKLRLKKGDTLLDVGCGWGGMVRYAARRGVRTIGVTLSEQQYEWARDEIRREGLDNLAEVRCMDYRDVPETGFDAISAIGIIEHVGVANYPDYFELLNAKLKTGGLMLNHSITYPDNRPRRAGAFIDRYIFPDGELTGSGTVIRHMQDNGFEVLHEENLRFDYQRTLHDWCENLKRDWPEAVSLAGEPTARLFGLYMAGSEWGFEHNVVQLHQVLGVKVDENGSRGDVPERMWWTV
ncbi:SAM-dependent methyltransferase [Corynebacterium pacaense]|uniref:SAM-dependent methyltransferase n=1 Tax=Corynebacterium pacaense TaxID=1816684 RepID=UPI0009BC2A41|nr:cyclopropane-fatty-acyl-phospholipid synthase family protein [Corynebacterium pacaense]